MSDSDFQQSSRSDFAFSDKNNNGRKLFLEILDGEIGERPAFWFMRQAGRYLPEYRELRAQEKSFLDLVFNPKKASEITLQPIRRFGMDAAILFSDILVIPHALQQKLVFEEQVGPKLDPIREVNDLSKLNSKKFRPMLSPIGETIELTRKALPSSTALIGFCGAPWTVSTYMIEGGSSKDYAYSKKWAYRDPKGLSYLQTIIQESTLEYLSMQVDAGVDAIMIFDSHAGQLPPALFESLVIKPTQKLVKQFKDRHPHIPVIGFARGASQEHLLRYVRETGINAVQIDEMTSIKWAYDEFSMLMPIQGNMDPAVLIAGGDTLKKTATHIMNRFCDRPFIFNLGHGMNKNTPVKHVEYLASLIREFSNFTASIEMASEL